MVLLAPDAKVLSRHQHATHYEGQNGQKIAVFQRDANYFENGQWYPTSLEFETTANGTVAKRLPYHRVELSPFGVAVVNKQGQGVRWLTPFAPVASGRRASFAKDGLLWAYEVRRNGAKLEATVLASRGPKTYEFTYQLVGLKDWQVTPGGDLRSGELRVARPFVIDANGKRHDCGPWRVLNGPRVAFSFDDTGIPTPYTLDPTTTFEPAASADDGYALDGDASYPPPGPATSGTANATDQVAKQLSGGNYFIGVTLIRWDTSSLADTAVVSAADLKLYATSKTNADSRNLTAEWYYTWPIGAGSYTSTVGTDAHAGTSINSISTGAYNTFALTNAATGVKVDNYTGVRLHISGADPTGSNDVTYRTFDNGADEPQLVVTYTQDATVNAVSAAAGVGASAPDVVVIYNVDAVSAGAGGGSGTPVVSGDALVSAVSSGAGVGAGIATISGGATVLAEPASAGAQFGVPVMTAYANYSMSITVMPRVVTGTVSPREVTAEAYPRVVTGVITP